MTENLYHQVYRYEIYHLFGWTITFRWNPRLWIISIWSNELCSCIAIGPVSMFKFHSVPRGTNDPKEIDDDR